MSQSSLREVFNSVFSSGKESFIEVCAPGRVNLIGEHTDYNDGFVCPMAIDRYTTILLKPRNDAKVRMYSTLQKQTAEWSVDAPVAKEGPKWALYPKGVTEILRQKGKLTRGMDAVVESTVPLGGGLSSSAAFEVATGLALLEANGQKMDLVELALAGQWAEHNYPGMPCGIMDQFISAMGQQGHALLLDCRDRSTKQVPLDDPNVRVLIANSNVKHELVSGEYQARRNQCEAAVAWLKKKNPKLKSLRDATVEMLEDNRMGMDPTVYKRAHHVITEIARTTAFGDALMKHDYNLCGKLMYESHASLRDDYAVSCAELDTLVEIARTVPGTFGARMTGGGFGGCIVALVKADAADKLTKTLHDQYLKQVGKEASIFITVPSEGAHKVK